MTATTDIKPLIDLGGVLLATTFSRPVRIVASTEKPTRRSLASGWSASIIDEQGRVPRTITK